MKYWSAARAIDRQGGFTLMELLVAMTLLGILMAAMFGGLRLGARVWEASDQGLDDRARNEVVRGFLRRRLEEVLPIEAALSDDRTETLFRGERTALRIASTMPISLGSAPYLIEFRLRPSANRDGINDLVVAWQALDPEQVADDHTPNERILIDDVADMAIGYFGQKQNQPTSRWFSVWQDQDALPDLIKIEIGFPATDGRRWQTLVVSPMIDEWYDTAY
ncbi:MAG: prepilin-type N-terminal cleavage/methylation domain-containing protein [Geminicoccaceae bacterium]